MRFEWDARKNKANVQKHKIDFADVPYVFSSPVLVELDTREDYGEERYVGIGLLRGIAVVVVFIEPRKDAIRIISARKANRYERKKYEEAITD